MVELTLARHEGLTPIAQDGHWELCDSQLGLVWGHPCPMLRIYQVNDPYVSERIREGKEPVCPWCMEKPSKNLMTAMNVMRMGR
jgi:hypothetical protein